MHEKRPIRKESGVSKHSDDRYVTIFRMQLQLQYIATLLVLVNTSIGIDCPPNTFLRMPE
jgi:hypothetical protein